MVESNKDHCSHRKPNLRPARNREKQLHTHLSGHLKDKVTVLEFERVDTGGVRTEGSINDVSTGSSQHNSSESAHCFVC